MKSKKLKRNLVLGVLFILPVIFLLMLIPAKHNYRTLDIVNLDVKELRMHLSNDKESISFKDHITVLGFLGNQPLDNLMSTSNLKELIYDNFKGFKRFQIVMLVQEGRVDEIERLKREIVFNNTLTYFHFIESSPAEILSIYNTLKSKEPLDNNLSTPEVFIIDKERNQRGRIDDAEVSEGQNETTYVMLPSYNTIEIAELKNKMIDDMRVLLTEYRQKRKGQFNSDIRRANDISEIK